ncbi:MAG: nucleotidyltransferase [Candidatus Dormibacteraeota bacterium]|uniref:Nucleotidyltransferase n=1 Tax=Candidatus Amunia macphersoniae TaxID=3127014 RepID=A0A934KAX9_9BACT|nr:nucleotidyltransferase [Candidatus Dormibacteraeota bacterium]
MELDDAFETFFGAIALGALPEGRIESAWSRLREYLCSAYGLSDRDVFLQGSYANDTTVRPAFPRDEYDVDVITMSARQTQSTDEALQDLEGVLARDGDYAKRIERKTPCVRLRYASDDSGYLHFDVVPARRCDSAPVEIPRRRSSWKENDPEGYRNWCRSQGSQFIRTVRMLKRWRDIHQGQRRGVRSVVLQVLVAQAMPFVARDAHAVAGTFDGIATAVAGHPDAPPPLPHPTLRREDLTANWPDSYYQTFREHIIQASRDAREALADPDEASSHRHWRRLFGDDFPLYSGPSRQPPQPPPGYPSVPQQPPRSRWYG